MRQSEIDLELHPPLWVPWSCILTTPERVSFESIMGLWYISLQDFSEHFWKKLGCAWSVISLNTLSMSSRFGSLLEAFWICKGISALSNISFTCRVYFLDFPLSWKPEQTFLRVPNRSSKIGFYRNGRQNLSLISAFSLALSLLERYLNWMCKTWLRFIDLCWNSASKYILKHIQARIGSNSQKGEVTTLLMPQTHFALTSVLYPLDMLSFLQNHWFCLLERIP